MSTRHVDIDAMAHPSFLVIVPVTSEGAEWCEDHINAEAVNGAYHAEHRYGPTILLAAHNDGLAVMLDGRLADAPRTTQ